MRFSFPLSILMEGKKLCGHPLSRVKDENGKAGFENTTSQSSSAAHWFVGLLPPPLFTKLKDRSTCSGVRDEKLPERS